MLSSNASETVYKTRRDIPSPSLANNTYEMFGSYSHPTTLRTSTREAQVRAGGKMPVLITCGPPSSYPTLLIPYFRISAYPSIRILVFTNTSPRGTAKFHPPWSFPSQPPWLRTFGTSSTTTERSKWLRQPWNSDACEARPSGERFSLLVAPRSLPYFSRISV